MVDNPLLCWEFAIIAALLFAALVFWLAKPQPGTARPAAELSACPGCIDAVPIEDAPSITTSQSHTTKGKPASE